MAKATKTRRVDGISFRSFTNSWHSSITGKYAPLRDEQGNIIKGKANEPTAMRAYHRLALLEGMAPEQKAATLAPTVGEVCDQYLDFLRKDRAYSSYKYAKDSLNLFCKFVRDERKATDIQRHELKNFLMKKTTWGNARQGAAIAHVVAAFNYAVETGAVSANPFNKFRKPVAKARVVLLNQEQEAEILRVAKKGFADYFKFLILSGARPDEGARIETKHFQETPAGLQIVLHEHKSARKTGKVRVIHLFPEAEAIVREWAKKNPVGPIFRRPNRQPWNRKASVACWASIRDRIQKAKGVDFLNNTYTVYCARHTCATRHLLAGASIATVAAILGNTPRMIESCYGHLCLCQNHLLTAMETARGAFGLAATAS